MNGAPNTDSFRGTRVRFHEENGSAADPHAVHPPAIAVPEALTLPVTGADRAGGIGRAVVARAVAVGAWAVIIAGTVVVGARGDCASDDGAADQARGETWPPTSAPGLSGRGRRNGKRGNGCECHQSLPHGITFPTQRGLQTKFHISLERSMNDAAIFMTDRCDRSLLR